MSDRCSAVLGIMNGQHVAFKGQPLAKMLQTPAVRSQRTMGKTISSPNGE